jgi:hypothetical protein
MKRLVSIFVLCAHCASSKPQLPVVASSSQPSSMPASRPSAVLPRGLVISCQPGFECMRVDDYNALLGHLVDTYGDYAKRIKDADDTARIAQDDARIANAKADMTKLFAALGSVGAALVSGAVTLAIALGAHK